MKREVNESRNRQVIGIIADVGRINPGDLSIFIETGLNGTEHISLQLDKHAEINPCVDISSVYNDELLLKANAKKIADTLIKARGSITRQEILDNVYVSVINRRKNQKIRKNCPHMNFLDLMAVFRTKQDFMENSNSFLITYELANKLKIHVQDLYEAAKEHESSKADTICNTIALLGCDPDTQVSKDSPLYAIGADKNGYGDGSIFFYKKGIKALSDELDADLYVLPSSIHELLLISTENGMSLSEIINIVHDVNKTLRPEDFLSNNVYYYDRENETICIAENDD